MCACVRVCVCFFSGQLVSTTGLCAERDREEEGAQWVGRCEGGQDGCV